jgi:hypothetical protein
VILGMLGSAGFAVASAYPSVDQDGCATLCCAVLCCAMQFFIYSTIQKKQLIVINDCAVLCCAVLCCAVLFVPQAAAPDVLLMMLAKKTHKVSPYLCNEAAVQAFHGSVYACDAALIV